MRLMWFITVVNKGVHVLLHNFLIDSEEESPQTVMCVAVYKQVLFKLSVLT